MAREAREEPMELSTGGEVTDETRSLPLYETQFLEFTPRTCVLKFLNIFRDSMCAVLPQAEKWLLTAAGGGGSDAADKRLLFRARQCSRLLLQKTEEAFGPPMERMQAVLLKFCLSVPPKVLLREDKLQIRPQDAQKVLGLKSSIADLQRSYEAEVCARQALLAELEEQKEVQKQLDGILTWIRELQKAWVTEDDGTFLKSVPLLLESNADFHDGTPDADTSADMFFFDADDSRNVFLDADDSGADEVFLDADDSGADEVFLDADDIGADEVFLDADDSRNVFLDADNIGADEVFLDADHIGADEVLNDADDGGNSFLDADLFSKPGL